MYSKEKTQYTVCIVKNETQYTVCIVNKETQYTVLKKRVKDNKTA